MIWVILIIFIIIFSFVIYSLLSMSQHQDDVMRIVEGNIEMED